MPDTDGGLEVQAHLSRRRLSARLGRYLALHAVVAVALVVTAAVVWPPTLGPTGLALVLLFGVAESHPYQLRSRGRAESVVLPEYAVALAALALATAEVPWVAVGGALAASPMVRWFGTHERLRVAAPERHILNVAKNVIGLTPLVVLTALARPHGLPLLWAATGAGLAVYAVLTHAIVRGAVDRARGSRGPSRPDEYLEVLRIAAVLTAMVLPVGMVLRTDAPMWPLVLSLGVAFILIARARMGRETAAYRLSVVSHAIDALATAHSVAGIDDRLRGEIAHALAAGAVELVDEEPPTQPRIRDQIVGRIGDSGPWVSVTRPVLSTPWTPADRELLQALLAAAAPARQRLEDLARVEEAERFASLLLTAAGHDVANQLHAARLATETLLTRGDQLPEDRRAMVLDRADAALQRGARALSDMVALGAGGPDARCTGAEVALFVRDISANLRVVADNVVIGAPSAVVERIIENLVTNAARHHVGRDPVEVAVAADGSDVRIAVLDRGPGLEAKDVELLFRPFAQLADGARRRGSLGLGLFVARGLAESVGGSLAYADRVGGGARFEVRLPSAREDAVEGVQERVVLGPRADRHTQAPVEPWLRREVADEDALSQ